MNRKAMISIIVPVYNAAEYLTDCIESILGQKDQNIEIILVNDGSGDESGSICRTYKKADSRIKYIEIENSGVSAARNIGMERASGEWVCFADADDRLCEYAIDSMREALDESADAVYCNYLRADEDASYSEQLSTVQASEIIEATFDYSGMKSQMSRYAFMHPMFFSACWGKLYKRNIIEQNQIRFPAGIRLSEDLCFNVRYLMYCRNVRLFDKAVYQYRVNMASVTHNDSFAHLENRSELIELLNSWNTGREEYERAKNKYILLCILRMNEKIGNVKEKKKAVALYREISSRAYVRKIICDTKNQNLSDGRYQEAYYKAIVYLLRFKCVRVAVKIGQIYSRVRNGRVSH